MQWPSSIKYPLSYGASHSDSLIQVHIERQAGILVEFGLLLWHIEHVFVCLIHILGLSWVFQTGILEFPVYDIVCTALCSVSEHLSIWDCMQVGEFHDLHMTIVGAQVHQDGNYTGLHSSKTGIHSYILWGTVIRDKDAPDHWHCCSRFLVEKWDGTGEAGGCKVGAYIRFSGANSHWDTEVCVPLLSSIFGKV